MAHPLLSTVSSLPNSSREKLNVARGLLNLVSKTRNPLGYALLHYTVAYLEYKTTNFTNVETLKHLKEAALIFDEQGRAREGREVSRFIRVLEDAKTGKDQEDEELEGWFWGELIGKVNLTGRNSGGKTFLRREGGLNRNSDALSNMMDAINVTRENLKGLDVGQMPEEHARLSNNLALLLHTRYEESGDEDALREAVHLFDNAIKWFVGTEGGYKADEKATICKNAAGALIDTDIGESLAEAVQLLESAESNFTRERFAVEIAECRLLRASAMLRLAIKEGSRTFRAHDLAEQAQVICEQCIEAVAGRYGQAKILEQRANKLRADASVLIAEYKGRAAIENAIDNWKQVAKEMRGNPKAGLEEVARCSFQLGRLLELKHKECTSDVDTCREKSLSHYVDAAKDMRRAANSSTTRLQRERRRTSWAILVSIVDRVSQAGTRTFESRKLVDDALDEARTLLQSTSNERKKF